MAACVILLPHVYFEQDEEFPRCKTTVCSFRMHCKHPVTPHLSTPQSLRRPSHFFFIAASQFSFSSLCAPRVSLTTSHRVAADVSGNVTRTQTGGRTGHTCTHTHSTPASRADQSLHTLCSLASPSRAFSPNGEPALNCGFSPTPTYTFVSFQPLPSPNSCSWVAAVGSNL